MHSDVARVSGKESPGFSHGENIKENGQGATRFTYPRSLYGWDCETILILNARAIREYTV